MALLLFFFFFLLLSLVNSQPSPGYYPSTKLRPLSFYQGYNSLWEPQHQTVSQDQSSITIGLDKYSGSGFKLKIPYLSGYFNASVKLQSGYTAGVNTAFYHSNNEAHPGYHDEVDIEFLGTIPGKPCTLQTNVYVMGSGDGRIIGREMRFHLWFDPTADFHNYAILWNSDEIILAILMGLNFLEFIELKLPSFFNNFDPRTAASNLPSGVQAYLAGLTFALAASPCSTSLLLAASVAGALQGLLSLRKFSAWINPASGALLLLHPIG